MELDWEIIEKVRGALVKSGSTFFADKKRAYEEAINKESNFQAKWVMEKVLENAALAEKNGSPLCDDTGIPHIVLEVGPNRNVSGLVLESIYEGVRLGLRDLPGRPMAITGTDSQRIDQSQGLYEDPGMVEPAPFLIRCSEENVLKIYILMFGGGPAIRAHTQRVFHKHNTQVVLDQIVEWAIESTAQLGCTPCTLAIGVGRSHYEATSMMVQALIDGSYGTQSDMEQEITVRVNESKVGALGLGGDTTVLATFMKVGPQRASGVRIVCLRPCCCFEPRISVVEL